MRSKGKNNTPMQRNCDDSSLYQDVFTPLFGGWGSGVEKQIYIRLPPVISELWSRSQRMGVHIFTVNSMHLFLFLFYIFFGYNSINIISFEITSFYINILYGSLTYL